MVNSPARWALRDWLAAIGLFAATAAVVLWQNAHVAVLWDLSYVLDSATRIAQGQLPYRDFPFAHALLTFLIQAAIIRLTGRDFFHHVLYAAIVGGLGTVLTWRIALSSLLSRVKKPWLVSLILAAPLTVLGIYCILPLPSYDCDCVLAILVAIYLLQRLRQTSSWLYAMTTGAALCLPLFFKQNIGLPFLAAACGILAVALAAGLCDLLEPPTIDAPARALSAKLLFAVLTGIAVALSAALLALHFTVGLENYYHWTIQFAAQRRLPGLQQMLGVYQDPQLLWKLPCILAAFVILHRAKAQWPKLVALILLAVPFAYTLCTLFIYDDADERGDSLLALWPMLLILAAALALWNLRTLRIEQRLHFSVAPILPILILTAIHGAFMSQQLWGSTYATWPLLILLIAEMVSFLAGFRSPAFDLGKIMPAIAAGISVTLLVCGALYIASEERLSYAQLPAGPAQHSTFPQLNGLSTPGPYLQDFDELLRYADAQIPASDGIILIPGEDPFYFATGRTPQFPVLLFDPATDPLSPAQVTEAASRHNIRWLIVKHNLQLTADPTPQREATIKLLLSKFKPAASLHAYDIYRIR
jgi:hypothetical protein